MSARKMLLAALAAFAAMFLLSWVWHELLFADFYADTSPGSFREAPLLWAVGLGYAVLALLMAWMFPKGYQGGSSVAEGVRFGMVMALVWILPLQLVLFGVLDFSIIHTAVDVPWHLVEQGIGGALIGFIHGRASTSVEEAPARPASDFPGASGGGYGGLPRTG